MTTQPMKELLKKNMTMIKIIELSARKRKMQKLTHNTTLEIKTSKEGRQNDSNLRKEKELINQLHVDVVKPIKTTEPKTISNMEKRKGDANKKTNQASVAQYS